MLQLDPQTSTVDGDVLKKHGRSFYWASFFLAQKARTLAATLYAFCRWVDDAVDEAESQLLNNQYRKKNEPTNVLSFLISDNPLLGDIILCHSVIKKEALAQKKSIDDHYAHLIIHGYLHLIGFDHTKNDDALTMENKEIAILKKLGIKNPYLSNIM